MIEERIKADSERPEKCEKGHSLNPTTQAKCRECDDGEFKIGGEINCNLCKQKIIIEEGYYTCMDACDFAVHKQCFGGK